MDSKQHSKLLTSSPSTAHPGPEPVDLRELPRNTADPCTPWEEDEASPSTGSIKALAEHTISQRSRKRTTQDNNDQDLIASSFEPVKKRQDSPSQSTIQIPPSSELISSHTTLGFVPCPQDYGGPDVSGGDDFSSRQRIHGLSEQDHSSPVVPRFYGPLGRQKEEFNQGRSHSFLGGSDGQDLLATREDLRMQQRSNMDGDNDGASFGGDVVTIRGLTDPKAYATVSATSRSYSSLALLDESEHVHAHHLPAQDTRIFPPSCGGRVKSEDEPSTSASDCPSGQNLALISNGEFNQSGQVEGEEPIYGIVSTQPSGENDSILSRETWSHSNVTYQQHVLHQQQQSLLGSLSQQLHSQSTQEPLPSIKVISGFYPNASLPELSPMVDCNHYHFGPQDVHSQFLGLYASAHYTAPSVGPLPLPHDYPIAVGFQEIPLPKRRRDRRSAHSQQPYGAATSRQRSGFKTENLSDEGELLDSTIVKTESFKQEQNNGGGSDGPNSFASRRQEVQERDPDPKACNNCQTTSTPSWRRCPKGRILLCNACGLYQKLHGKSRPHYMAKDGTIKIQRTIPEHAPCVQCHTRNSPSWKKGPHGEAICHPCSTAIKNRSQTKVKRVEYPSSVESMSAGMGGVVGLYADGTPSAEYSETISMRGSHARGLTVGAGEGSFSDVESMHQQQRRLRHSSKISQQGYLVDNHPSTGQYQGGHSFVYGISQVTPAYGLGQYGGYDASRYNLAYPSSLSGWQPDAAAYGSAAYSGAFNFESSPPQQGQSSSQRGAMGLFRVDSSSSFAIPVASQPSSEGHQQLLVPYGGPSQVTYPVRSQPQQSRLVQSSLHSSNWSSVSGGGSSGSGGGGQAMGISPELTFSHDQPPQQQQHQDRMLFSQRSAFAGSGLSAIAPSNEALRPDRYQVPQHQQQYVHQDTSFAHHPSIPLHQRHRYQSCQHQQQPQLHVCHTGTGFGHGQKQQQPHYHSYPDTVLPSSVSKQNQSRSQSPNQDRESNQDYETALQSYVQGGGGGGSDETSVMIPANSAVSMGDPFANVTDGVFQEQVDQVDQGSGTTVTSAPTPAHADLGVQTEPLHQTSPISQHSGAVFTTAAGEGNVENNSNGNLGAMAVETLVSTLFDRQSSVPASTPLPVSETDRTSSRTPATAAMSAIADPEAKKSKKRSSAGIKGMSDEGQSSLLLPPASLKQQLLQHGPIASLTLGRSVSAPAPISLPVLMHSAISDETGSPRSSGDDRSRRSDRDSTTSVGTSSSTEAAAAGETLKPVKRQEGLMSQHLNRPR
ncbi:hypothetical protein EC991_003719 [Linnemannia zychae]|nr:hypothetical protein EC991_003719 [Linnemannia zychae]